MGWFAGGGTETEREVQVQGRSVRDSWQTVEELSEAKLAEHSGAQTLSGVEMLRTVRDLNEGSTKSWLACPRNGRNWSHRRPLVERISTEMPQSKRASSRPPLLGVFASTPLPRSKQASAFVLPIPRRVKAQRSVTLSPPSAGF